MKSVGLTSRQTLTPRASNFLRRVTGAVGRRSRLESAWASRRPPALSPPTSPLLTTALTSGQPG
eukprot:4655776-Lingulodinium_polyedra.AAC.1